MSIVQNRLAEMGLVNGDVLCAVHIDDNILAVIAYTSHLEGLGTRHSDIDVYALVKSTEDIECARETALSSVKFVVINGAKLDIEYIAISKIESFADLLSKENVNVSAETLKALNRIRIGEQLYPAEATQTYLKKIISQQAIKVATYKFYQSSANAELEDAMMLFREKEYVSSLMCARAAVKFAIGALNTQNDNINLSVKWVEKIFLMNEGYGYLQEYMDCLVFSSISDEKFEDAVVETVELAQKILSKAVLGM